MSDSKGKQRFALGVGVFGAVAWLGWVIIFSPFFEGLTALIPFVAILLAWWRHIIGGSLVLISSFVPLIVLLSYYQSNPGDQLGVIVLFIPVLATATAPLLVSGRLFLILGIRQRQSPE